MAQYDVRKCLYVTVTEDDHRLITGLADADGLSVAMWIRRAMDGYLLHCEAPVLQMVGRPPTKGRDTLNKN